MNNPVNMEDPTGNIAWWIIGGIAGAVVGGIAGAVYSYKKTGSVDWRYVAGGAVAGGLVGAGLGYLAQGAYTAIVGAAATTGAATTQSATEQTNKIKKGWDMVKGGARIGGRKYTEHALERMAPDIPQVRAELSKRALDKGIKFGTEQFKKYVDPRGIPPMVVEHTINYGGRMAGNRPGTWIAVGEDVRVVVNLFGDVMSVIPK